MRTAVLFVLLSALAPACRAGEPKAADPPARDAVQADVKALQGTWLPVAYEHAGKREVPAAVAGEFEEWVRNVTLHITGKKLVFGQGEGRPTLMLRRGGKPRGDTVWLDPASKPKRFDINFGRGGGLFGGSLTFEGIYRLRGDRLEICCALSPSEARPTTFTTRKAQESRWLIVYRRVKSPGK